MKWKNFWIYFRAECQKFIVVAHSLLFVWNSVNSVIQKHISLKLNYKFLKVIHMNSTLWMLNVDSFMCAECAVM